MVAVQCFPKEHASYKASSRSQRKTSASPHAWSSSLCLWTITCRAQLLQSPIAMHSHLARSQKYSCMHLCRSRQDHNTA